MRNKSWLSQLFAGFLQGFRPRRKRLQSTIAEFESELKRNALPEEGAQTPKWLEIAQELLAKAKTAAERGLLDEGWKCLTAASRMEIYGLGEDEKTARVLALRAEAKGKLTNWRREAIEKILKSERDTKLAKKVLADHAVAKQALEDATAADEILRQNADVANEIVDPAALAVVATEDEDLAARLAEDLDQVNREPSVSRERLYCATQLRDEASHNKYFQSSYYRNQLVWLLLVMAVALLAFFVVAEPAWFHSESSILTGTAQPVDELQAMDDEPAEQIETQVVEADSAGLPDPEVSVSEGSEGASQDAQMLVGEQLDALSEPWRVDKTYILGIILLGIMGGGFSAILSLSPAGADRQIPAQIVDSYVTVFRPALGAVGALVVYAFIVSGIINFSSFSAPAALAVAFVAGFSERLVLRGVETVSGRDDRASRESG